MSRRPADWEKILSLTKMGMNRLQVAYVVNCSSRTVQNVLRKHGLLNSKKVAGGKRGYRRYCSGI